MNNKFTRILEWIWGITSIAVFGTAIYSTLHSGFRQSLVLYLFLLIAVSMFLMRRNMRKKNQQPS